MSLESFHPIIREWFESKFRAPTPPQCHGWPRIAHEEHALIAAPTGSGKTLTAFLAIIDRLLKSLLSGEPINTTQIVYVSPLRALSNDMHKSLTGPLRELAETADRLGIKFPAISVGLRTGDTSSHERQKLNKRPPHILVTTPESLYLMLTAEKSRKNLKSVRTVIIDEIHALTRDKRGAHLSLTLERLEHLVPHRLQRIGLSATQKPLERVAEFLVGQSDARATKAHALSNVSPRQKQLFPLCIDEICEEATCADQVVKDVSPNLDQPLSPISDTKQSQIDQSPIDQSPIDQPTAHLLHHAGVSIVDIGYHRTLDLQILTPDSELSAVCSHEQWAELNHQIVELINSHRSTLIFVNTRRMAERMSHQLTQILGDDAVSSHHGSLSAEIRLATEQRLKTGQLKAVVATASLEMGIDIGYIDLVIQIGSPRAISAFLQRIGRSGHALGLIPKGRLLALTRDELIEAMALIRAVKLGHLDSIQFRNAPLDVLAQQIVAEVCVEEWSTDALYDLCRSATPYQKLTRKDFDDILQVLSEGITHNNGRSHVFLHHDHVGKKVRARKGARITAVNNAGSIPEVGSYRVVTAEDKIVVGSVDEEFAVESSGGDIFLLGNSSWRIVGIRGGDLVVSDAHGAPPTIPFWQGEAPGRTFELSEEVSSLREELERRIISTYAQFEQSTQALEILVEPLSEQCCCSHDDARQASEYIAAQHAALGCVPSQKKIVFERFFDQTGGMQVVVHAPFGSRITRGWGLAMRKRFCRSFDFELQATADDDGFILTLGPQHSFPLESLFPMLTAANVRNMLEQAVIYVPTFQLRWRWNVTSGLLVERRRNGQKVPPPLQRFRADDLLTAVFPKLTGCQEEHVGDHEFPDHPLVQQTLRDCMEEAFDLAAIENVLSAIERGEITMIARDTREPSPFSYELLNAMPYAFLDGGEVQDRRARAVQMKRSFSVESVSDLGRLDPLAIQTVVSDAQPQVRTPDELHDLLLGRIALPVNEAASWMAMFHILAQDKRATQVTINLGDSSIPSLHVLVAAERLPAVKALDPAAQCQPQVSVPQTVKHDWDDVTARVAIVRGLMELAGPLTTQTISIRTGFTYDQCFAALEALEGEGSLLRGHFTPECSSEASPASSSPTDSAQTTLPLEWCHRRLLSRIHRLTVEGLRQQIEPVTLPTFMRFLTRHQGILAGHHKQAVAGLFEVVAQLQGLDVQAAAWEPDVLAQRVADYQSAWLDELCFTGEVSWGRLFPPALSERKARPMVSLSKFAPISLYLRDDLGWLCLKTPPRELDDLSSPARQAVELLTSQGAIFATDLQHTMQLMPTQLTDVLGELVSRGVVTSDGFSGLRGLIGQQSASHAQQQLPRVMRQRQRHISGQTGRWSLLKLDSPSTPSTDHLEQWAWQLLRRWGVVFKDILQTEQGAPPWWQLVSLFRKLEARGEIRGGRFIKGVSGEQFASAETVSELRTLRDQPPEQELVYLSAADPLNLTGILGDDPRIPATTHNRLAYHNGHLAASLIAGELTFHRNMPQALQLELRTGLLQCQSASPDLDTPPPRLLPSPPPSVPRMVTW